MERFPVSRNWHICLWVLIAALLAPALTFAQDPAQDTDVEFEADTVTISQDDGSMIAEGNVVLVQGQSTLKADKVIYNQQTDIAHAIGNVALISADGTVTKADMMELDSNFTHAIAQPMISDFIDGSRFAASKGEGTAGVKAVYNDSSYTPCNCDYDKGERPIWDLRSSKAVHDLKTKTIRHENVRMTIFGLPIFYIPILAHPDWTVKRRSGFLTPHIKYSSDLGLAVTAPYFKVISPTQDVELQPTKFPLRGEGLKSIYRQKWDNSELEANIYTANVETFKKSREAVAAIDALYTARIGAGWRVTGKLKRSSQDTFLRRYGYDSADKLKSSLAAEKLTANRYYKAEMSETQSLKKAAAFSNAPTLLPSVFYEKTQAGFRHKQRLRTQISALHLDNDEGYEMIRWSSAISMFEEKALAGGIGSYDVGLLSSYFDIQNTPDSKTKMNELGRANAHISLEWKSPIQLANKDRRVLLEPRIKYTHIFGTDRTDDIPNRDSADFRLDEANMFLTHRYQGLDYVLPGSRFDMGLSAITRDKTFGKITGFVGVSRRFSGKASTGLNTTKTNKNLSDYVASLAVDPPGPFSLSWAGRADSDGYKLNESRTNISFKQDGTSIDITHNQLAKAHFTAATDDLEEAALTISQTLGDGWSAKAYQVWDLSAGQSTRKNSTVSLLWSGGYQDCLSLALNYKRDPIGDRDIKTVDEVQLVLNFKYLGAISQSDSSSAK